MIRLPQLNGAIPIVEVARTMTQQFRDYMNRLRELVVTAKKFTRIATGNVTLTDDDYYVIYNSGSFTVSLPTAVGREGKEFEIKNSGTGLITVDPNGTETIDGSLTKILRQYDGMKIVSDGTNWAIA